VSGRDCPKRQGGGFETRGEGEGGGHKYGKIGGVIAETESDLGVMEWEAQKNQSQGATFEPEELTGGGKSGRLPDKIKSTERTAKAEGRGEKDSATGAAFLPVAEKSENDGA